jgi:para-nitrobenzyl esterase
LLRHAGVKDVAGLRSLSTQGLLAVQESVLREKDLGEVRAFGPVVDGNVLPVPPLHAIRSGSANNVALLTGTTRDEARLWTLYDPYFGERSPEAWNRCLQGMRAPNLETLRTAYRLDRPQLAAGDVNRAILGDMLFRLPLIRLAEAQAGHRSDTRMYLFTWQTPVRDGRLGSPHAVELPFVFGNLDAKGVSALIGNDPNQHLQRQALTEAVQGAWIAFARTGDPSHPGLPSWPAYETEDRHTLVFDVPCVLQADPLAAERSVWGDIPFDGVAPLLEELPW